jgi:sensor histidine kinase regulating citrate/malate metabolism
LLLEKLLIILEYITMFIFVLLFAWITRSEIESYEHRENEIDALKTIMHTSLAHNPKIISLVHDIAQNGIESGISDYAEIVQLTENSTTNRK